ncbi:MAG: MFS transporter [Acidimicrobiia bacterium]|nr:MFS transporter [Acidimicrobiia bacterium]
MIELFWRRPEFKRLFLAHSISRAGDAFNTVALVVLVFDLTGSGVGVAGAVVFEVLPVLLLGPVAGFAADRFRRKQLMVAADVGRAAIAIVVVMFADSVAVAYAVAFGLSAGAVVFNPAASSLLPEVVGEDGLVAANSALWSAAVVGQIALAPTAGVVISTFGVEAAFAVNAASFVISALLLVGLRAGRAPVAVAVRGWAGVLDGVRTVRGDRLLTRLAVVQVLASLSAGATGGLLVVLADTWIGVGPNGFGLLLAAIGIGAALGPALVGRLVRPGERRWLFGPFAVRGGVDLTLATVANPLVAGSALVVYGMSTSTGMVAYQSTLQTVVPSDTRGRVFAFYDVLWNSSRLLSLAIGGVVTELLGVRIVYLVAGLLLFGAAAIGLTTRLEPDS